MQAQAVMLARDVVLQYDLIKESNVGVVSDHPVEYLAFKKLHEAVFGKGYEYQQEKTDKEILEEVLCEKYASLESIFLENIKEKKC